MISYKVERKIQPAKLNEAHFAGKVGEKFQKVIYQRVTSDHAHNNVFREAEDAFLNCVDDKDAPIGIWQGEFWGKLMISACECYRYTCDESIKKFIKGSVERVLTFQREDGYLGTYKNEHHVFAAERSRGLELYGAPCNWTWNVWCRKYTLWGLVEAYQILHDEHILECAAASADQLIDMLHEMGARITETGTFYGLPSSSILKPMLILYRLTENKKYLDFAMEIANQWEDDDTCCMKIISMSLKNVPIHHWSDNIQDISVKSKGNPFFPEGEPAVRPECFNIPEKSLKVYEMQSCFEGLLELYQIVGVERYLEATKRFFNLMLKDEYNTIFSVGYNDLFLNAGKFANSISELCDVIHFMRLGTDLYYLTGDPKYLDYVEMAFYNPFLAGVARDGSWAARAVRNSEGHKYVSVQAGFIYNHCCTNNMPRGFTKAAELIVGSNDKAVFVNLYGEADVTVHPTPCESVHVVLENGYMRACEAVIRVSAVVDSKKILNLRIPSWSRKTTVTINGETYPAQSGTYFEATIFAGEYDIRVNFDNEPRVLYDEVKADLYQLTPYLRGRYASAADGIHVDTIREESTARVCVGPILLAGTVDLGSTKEEVFNHRKVYGSGCTCSISQRANDGLMACYDVKFTWPDGNTFVIPMGDFASVSDEREHKDYRFTIFV